MKSFLEQIIISPKGCWEWQGITRKKGGLLIHITSDNKHIGARKYSYQTYKREIPSGHYTQVKCKNSLCVNPKHIFLIDHGTLILMSLEKLGKRGYIRKASKECSRGHKKTPENGRLHLYNNHNHWVCRICHTQYMREWRNRNKELRVAA